MATIEPSVDFTTTPNKKEEGTLSVSATANTGTEDTTKDFQIQAQFEFFADGEIFDTQVLDNLVQDQVVSATSNSSFDPGRSDLRVRFRVDLYGVDGFAKDTGEIDGNWDGESEAFTVAEVRERTFTSSGERVDDTRGIKNSYDGVIDFEISNIVGSDTGPTPEKIEFEYPNPAIGIDTGGNFVTHDIIGGATVRQRIGDQPLELSITGVAEEGTAQKLDLLRNAQNVTLLSDRFSQNSLIAHVVSVSTDPFDDGGAADMKSGEFLYTFDLECVEILDTGDIDVSE